MPLFTASNAADMARRSWEVRKAQASQESVAAVAQTLPAQAEPPADEFLAGRLACVRAQLKLLDAAIQAELTSKEPDGQRVDRLAAASMRLSDQEFALSNRPKPGNRRPGPERGPKAQGGGAFWGSNPAQQSASPPAPVQPEAPADPPEEPGQDSP